MARAAFHLSLSQRVEHAIAALPTLSKEDIPLEDTCPICLQGFEAIYEGRAHEDVLAMSHTLPSGADPEELRGVTKLNGCGHIFCRLDMIEWIRGWHGTCPACRAQFANIRPTSYSTDGSSDGDYVPDDEDDEMDDEDDGFMDADGFDAEADSDFGLHSDDDIEFDDVLHDIGLPAGFDMAADIEAFMAEHAVALREDRRRAPTATTDEEDIDAYLAGRDLFVDDPLPELPGPGPMVNTGFLPAPANLVREGSEVEVLRDLAADDESGVGGWETAEAGIENWGLSHSDEEVSETLSERELLRSMEDINPHNDAVVVAEPGSSSIVIPRTESK